MNLKFLPFVVDPKYINTLAAFKGGVVRRHAVQRPVAL